MSHCSISNQKQFPFKLIKLPYDKKAFNNFFSKETFDYHYDKHHSNYVQNLNKILSLEENQHLHDKDLEKIITITEDKKIYNNAAQVWNHNFYWHCLTPEKLNLNSYKIYQKIIETYNTWENFTNTFIKKSIEEFGSGWSWLIFHKKEKKLEILTTHDAEIPFLNNNNLKPIFTCDLWEHAYYISFRNDRKNYISQMLQNNLNWNFLEKNYLNCI